VIFEFIKQVIESSGNPDYKDLVTGVLPDVDNRMALVSVLLQSCLPCVSPYDYESM
jgi:hypothetical protein